MTTAALDLPLARPPRTINPWIVAAAVVIPTFMEVLDATIANVALRYIAGGLSAPATDSEWVITSYLAANAIILPMSGWLSMRLGRRNYFLISIAIFTIASALCGMAPNLNALIAFRVLQGLAGGGLQPSSQGVLLDAFPPEKQGAAQTMFGIAALLAPVVGPTLGGYITDNYGWSWIFYLNIPVGAFALFMCWSVVRDPPYLTEQRKQLKSSKQRFDTLGLILLSTTMSSWEILLSKGQEWDWFGDPFWRVQILTAVFVFGLGALIIREMKIANPLVNFRTLKDRNFRSCCIIIFCAFGVLYANTTQLPAAVAAIVRIRRDDLGPGAFAGGVVRGAHADGRRDAPAARNRCALSDGGGIACAGAGEFLVFATQPGHQPVAGRLAARGGDRGSLDALRAAQCRRVPAHPEGTARRRRGVARAAAQRRRQCRDLHGPDRPGTPRAISHVAGERKARPAQPRGEPALHDGKAILLATQRRPDPLPANDAGCGSEQARHRQALSLAYFDVFWVSAALAMGLVFLVLLMRRSVAEKGAHVAAGSEP